MIKYLIRSTKYLIDIYQLNGLIESIKFFSQCRYIVVGEYLYRIMGASQMLGVNLVLEKLVVPHFQATVISAIKYNRLNKHVSYRDIVSR